MFESFDYGKRYLLYSGLLHAVRSNLGCGFVNNDQGHMVYRMGATGKYPEGGMGDSPDKSSLYQMMLELSASLQDADEFRSEDLVLSWADFCKLAIAGYNKHKTPSNA